MDRISADTTSDDSASGGAEATLPIEEARLFARAAGGDHDAISAVWRDNRRWIASVLAAHAPRGTDIDDLLQEVATTLVTKARHIRDASNLRGWLRVVAVNAARMAARSRSTERRVLHTFGQGRREAGATSSAGDASAILELVARLPVQYSEPLLLQAGQGLSQKQIADVMDLPETTVETRLARARRMLREMLRATEDERARGITARDQGAFR